MATHYSDAVIITQIRPALSPVLGHLLWKQFIPRFELLLASKSAWTVEKLLRRQDHMVLSFSLIEVHRIVILFRVMVS